MTPGERPLESVPLTARRHGLSVTSLYRWISSGDVPARCYVRLGGRLHCRRLAFTRWIEGNDLAAADASAQPPLRAVS
ncbi:MAG: helix-turn-helix transcriptional regulator [Chloroflexota bacterium]